MNVLLRSTVLLLGTAAAACVQPREDARAQPALCTTRVIVTLAETPDAALVADLARVSGTTFELVRTMTSDLHLFSLQAAGGDDVCAAAIERLRGDPRVRAIDVDQRRGIQSP